NSRLQRRNNQTWRRRRCPACRVVFTTHEVIDLSKSIVVKDQHGRLAPFSRDKLLLSIYKSCGHRRDTIVDAAALTETIVKRLAEKVSGGLITVHQIATESVSVLRNFDKASVVQYEAYHDRSLAQAD